MEFANRPLTFGMADRASSPILSGSRLLLLIGFGALLVLLAALGVYSVLLLDKVERVEAEATRLFIGRADTIHTLRTRLATATSSVRDYLVDVERSNLASKRREVNRVWQDLFAALDVARRDPLTVPELEREVRSYWEIASQTLTWDAAQLARSGYPTLTGELDPIRTRIVGSLDEIRTSHEDALRRAVISSTQEIAVLRRGLLIAIAATFLIGAAVAGLSLRQLIRLEEIAKQRFQELAIAHREQERLSQRILEVQEEERRGLARELHDEVSQSLGAMLVDMGHAANPRTPEDERTHLAEAKRIGEDVLSTIRNMCLGLRPSMLDDLGLIPALHWQARETSRRSGVRVTLTADDNEMELEDSHRTTVYRVVQEALQNIVRHAQATEAQIVLRREANRLVVAIQDDGKGFDPATTRGLGLLGMQERVARLNGVLRIESAPGKGTVLRIVLPLESGRHAVMEVSS